MSFATGTSYMRKYREAREAALLNNQPIDWFMSPMDNLQDMPQKFARTDERKTWTETYLDMLTNPKSKKTVDLLMRSAQKVDLLARWERDVRTLYIAAGDPDRVRSEVDRERYEYCRLAFVRKRLLNYVAVVGESNT